MTELERTLRELAVGLEHPPIPDLATVVEQRLRTERPRRPLRTRRLAIAASLALLMPAGAVAAVPPVRDAVRDVLGIEGVTIERVPVPVSVLPGGNLDLGQRMTLAQAAGRVDFPVVTPDLGPPDEVHYRPFPPGGALSLVYRRGLLLTQLRGTTFAGKFVGPGTSVQVVTVNGERGVWLAGRPHRFAYRDARGRVRFESLRLAGNTLLWQRGPLTLRLEGPISKATALRIARAVTVARR